MTETLSLPGLLVALVLPWATGTLWVRWLLHPDGGRFSLLLSLGYGFFAGIFAVTLIVRAWDAAGLALNFTLLSAVVAALGAAALLLQRTLPRVTVQGTGIRTPPWQLAVAAVLLGLLGWRYITLAQELLLRPLFAWDAWMNWAPKAIVWFHQGALVEFVSPEQWEQGAGENAYTLGNRQSWDYPPTVPLIQLWVMLGAGIWDHGAIYLPWLLAALSMGAVLFGHMRLAGLPLALSSAGCYLVLSLPFMNVHTALPGYADLWQAAAFTLGVCALFEWRRTRHRSWACLWVLMAVMCTQLKVPGIVLGLVIIGCGLRAWLDLRPRTELVVLVAGVLALVLAMLFEVSFYLPYLGEVSLDTRKLVVGRIGSFDVQYHPVGHVFVDTFLQMINWNLLAYLLPLFLLYALLRGRLLRPPPAEVLAVALAALLIVSVFFFTGYYRPALNFATLNRALLYPIPALIFVCLVHLPAMRPTPRSAHRSAGLGADWSR
ncbi:MAG: hypothetical protein U5K56_20040 [Halioglobus sp.]|nr:hypothetical protein [Halioglobus sp.]